MRAQLRLNLGTLRQVEDATQSSADHFSLALDFAHMDLELTLPKTMAAGAGEPPAALIRLREALQELAALAVGHG